MHSKSAVTRTAYVGAYVSNRSNMYMPPCISHTHTPCLEKRHSLAAIISLLYVECACCSQWRRLHRAWGHVSPFLQTAGHRGHHEQNNSKQETDQTVLTITKALTKTTNCTFRAKKWRGTTKRLTGASPPPLSRRTSVPAPPVANFKAVSQLQFRYFILLLANDDHQRKYRLL